MDKSDKSSNRIVFADFDNITAKGTITNVIQDSESLWVCTLEELKDYLNEHKIKK